ncbi:hypothetical protein lerEdw1_010825, partial [Lerista edwardsae]
RGEACGRFHSESRPREHLRDRPRWVRSPPLPSLRKRLHQAPSRALAATRTDAPAAPRGKELQALVCPARSGASPAGRPPQSGGPASNSPGPAPPTRRAGAPASPRRAAAPRRPLRSGRPAASALPTFQGGASRRGCSVAGHQGEPRGLPRRRSGRAAREAEAARPCLRRTARAEREAELCPAQRWACPRILDVTAAAAGGAGIAQPRRIASELQLGVAEDELPARPSGGCGRLAERRLQGLNLQSLGVVVVVPPPRAVAVPDEKPDDGAGPCGEAEFLQTPLDPQRVLCPPDPKALPWAASVRRLPWRVLRTMASPPKLAGETLIVHHIPLVHCQVPDRQCCGTGQRTNPFCPSDLAVARTSSLPERDLSRADLLVYSSLLRASEPDLAPAEAPGGQDGRAREAVAPAAHKRHNPFLGSATEAPGLCDGDPGQRSFRLHSGKSAFPLQELPPFHLHDAGGPAVKPWSTAGRLDVVEGREDGLPGEEGQRHGCLAPECMELDEYGCHRGDASSPSFEQDWAAEPDELPPGQELARSRTCSCSSSELQRCRCCSLSSQSEPLDQPMGYASDSSCNSSDGVLVNFSALYHKADGHSHPNLNSAPLSCGSSAGSHSDPGAFYLDLHSSPVESGMSCESPAPGEGSGRGCGCPHTSSPVLDANCNSCPPLCAPCAAEGSDLTACFQSQARLVVATQNYYKLVTCDLSSQSSPSPAGSSITSCSEEPPRGSPLQPTEYYLFQRPGEAPQEDSAPEGPRGDSQGPAEHGSIQGQVYVNVSPPTLAGGRQRSRSYDRHLDRSPASSRLGSLERMMSCPVKLSDSPALAVQSSPPKRVTSFAELAKGRKKTGSSPPLRSSRDTSLEFSPIPERQRDGAAFREGRGPRSRSPTALPSSPASSHSPEHGLSASGRGWSSREGPSPGPGGPEQLLFLSAWAEAGASPSSSLAQKDIRARADGGAADSSQAVVRYSKDQRPTTLPIQPFVFQHHFPRQPRGARALHSQLAASLSQLCSRPAASRPPASQPLSAASADQPVGGHSQRAADGAASLGEGCAAKPAPETSRPSPLGSYSPVRSSPPTVPSSPSAESSSPPSSPALESHPPRSRSCPGSATFVPARPSLATLGSLATLHRRRESPPSPPEAEGLPERQSPPRDEHRPPGSSLPVAVRPAGPGVAQAEPQAEARWAAGGSSEALGAGLLGALSTRALNGRSPRDHLAVLRGGGLPSMCGWRGRGPWEGHLSTGEPVVGVGQEQEQSEWQQLCAQRAALLHGQAVPSAPFPCMPLRSPRLSVKQLHLNYSEFFPDYFSLAEKPPAEFCLSPDGNTESISIDLLQKKGLVKAVNMAVDLIVAHFGTSRDPGVKGKLGNSSVSPNVGHLILKYLCPAIHGLLSDGLKAYVLDVIVGQRRNLPWSVVEASTQLGPSTKVLHGLCSKVGQSPELGSHAMRFNAFIFGLLNFRSLEFWFNHLYSHEDILQLHYQPSGFLPLAHGVCQGLFEEVLLLLQPLALLPFSLDLLFEHRLLQTGRQQQQQKELLRVRQDLLLSAHSTLQLMRVRGRELGESWAAGPGPAPASQRDSPQEDAPAAEEGRVKGVGAPSGGSERAEAAGRRPAQGGPPERKRDRQASWWYQLMQSSQVYIEAPPRRRSLCPPRAEEGGRPGGGEQAGGVREGASSAGGRGGWRGGLPRDRGARPGSGAPRETSARGQGGAEGERPALLDGQPAGLGAQRAEAPPGEREREPAGPEGGGPGGEQPAQVGAPLWLPEAAQGPQAGQQVEGAPRRLGQAERGGLPSGWLSLDRSVFQLVAQTVGASVRREAALEPPLPCPKQQTDRSTAPESPWEVKALCHHLATAAGQLSFRKGDVLRVLGKADADWLRCSRGVESGLVPIMYVTHPEDEDY